MRPSVIVPDLWHIRRSYHRHVEYQGWFNLAWETVWTAVQLNVQETRLLANEGQSSGKPASRRATVPLHASGGMGGDVKYELLELASAYSRRPQGAVSQRGYYGCQDRAAGLTVWSRIYNLADGIGDGFAKLACRDNSYAGLHMRRHAAWSQVGQSGGEAYF